MIEFNWTDDSYGTMAISHRFKKKQSFFDLKLNSCYV